MPAVNLSPFGPSPQFELGSGEPNVGGRLFFYVAGSNTKQNTYTDSTGAVANTNPIVLDATGMPTLTQVWFTSGLLYKVVYAPPGSDDPPSSPIRTWDNLPGMNDVSATADQWQASQLNPTYISATQFSVVGDQTGAFDKSRGLKTTINAGTGYHNVTASSFGGGITTVTVTGDALDSGLSAVSYGFLTGTDSAVPGGQANYTPTLSGASVNPVVGDGTLAGTYKMVNGLCWGSVGFVVGASTTTGTGAYTFSLPFPVATLPTGIRVNGAVEIFDASTGKTYIGSTNFGSGAVGFQMQSHDSSTEVGPTSPITLAVGDYITVMFVYPVA